MGWSSKRKYPEAPIGTLPTPFASLAEFDNVPSRRDLLNLFRALAVLAGALTFALILIWNIRSHFLEGLHPQWLGIFVIILPLFVGFGSWRWVRQIYLSLVEADDVKSLGQQGADSFYLGVAFCEGVWLYQGRPSWDRGFLHFEPDGLVFDARVGRFVLPFCMIRKVQITAARTTQPDSNPRLFIEWNGRTSQVNTMSFEQLDSTSSSDVLELVRDRITRALPGPVVPEIDSSELPLASASIHFPHSPAHFQSYSAERTPVIVLLLVLMSLTSFLEVHMEQIFEKHVTHMIFSLGAQLVLLFTFNCATFWYARLRRAGELSAPFSESNS